MTKIEWADESWNPIIGCSKISDGCKNCYAEKMAARLASMGVKAYKKTVDKDGCWTGAIVFLESVVNKPLLWKKPRKIFVCSMSDLFHEDVTFDSFVRVWETIRACPQHRFLVLTKRPERMKYFCDSLYEHCKGVPANIMLGVSVENQKAADERIPALLKTPCAGRFLSVEPMLEGMDMQDYLHLISQCIIGCESGPNRRPCKLAWVRDIVRQCDKSGVAVFVKQLEIEGKVCHDIEKFPSDLRRREYPER